jgi:hypothetical protein
MGAFKISAPTSGSFTQPCRRSRGWTFAWRERGFRLDRDLGLPSVLLFLLVNGQWKSRRRGCFSLCVSFEIRSGRHVRHVPLPATHPGKDDLLPAKQAARRSSRRQHPWIDDGAGKQRGLLP